MHIIKRLTKNFFSSLSVTSGGTKFNWKDTEKIKDGMTKSEVIAILGKPYSHTRSGNNVTLIWSYATVFGDAKATSCRFVADRVVSQTTIGK